MIRLPQLGVWLFVCVVFLEFAPPVSGAEARGIVKRVDVDMNQFVVMDNRDGNWVFHLQHNAKVLINGRESALFDLRTGDVVQVTYTFAGDRLMASLVRCERG